MTEPFPDGGWDPRADWEAQARAARDALAPPAGGTAAEPAPGTPAAGGALLPATTAVAEPVPTDQTVPLVAFTPFVAPLAPAAPVAGLDASQAGLAMAAARIGPARGMTSILGQDHLRGDVMPVRFLFPRLSLGRQHRWWIWRAGSAIAAGVLATVAIGWPAPDRRGPGPLRRGTVLLPDVPGLLPRCPGVLGQAAHQAAPRPAGLVGILVVARPGDPRHRPGDRPPGRGPGRDLRGGLGGLGPAAPGPRDPGREAVPRSRDQAARLEHAQWEAGQAARLIGAALGQPITARPAMVIYGPTIPWIVVRISGVDVFCGRRLRKYLRREAAGRSGYLDERQIEAIHDIAAQVLPPAG